MMFTWTFRTFSLTLILLQQIDVLNGIAWDRDGDRLFGKLRHINSIVL